MYRAYGKYGDTRVQPHLTGNPHTHTHRLPLMGRRFLDLSLCVMVLAGLAVVAGSHISEPQENKAGVSGSCQVSCRFSSLGYLLLVSPSSIHFHC